MAKKSRTYVWQFVIGLGFLSGLWTAIGFDPEAVILNALGKAADVIYPDPAIRSLFIILPTILLLFSVYGAYRKGRVPGLIAVIFAYLAGLSILVSTVTAILLLLVALFLGLLATNRRAVRKLGFR
jgi:hypothetical protein